VPTPLCSYHSVAYNYGAHAMVAVGSDGRVKHLVAGHVEFEAPPADAGHPLTALTMGRDERMLLAATADGALRAYVWVGLPRLSPSHAERRAARAGARLLKLT
jgi:hypothetical protein